MLPNKFVVSWNGGEEYSSLVSKLYNLGYKWQGSNDDVAMACQEGVIYAYEDKVLNYTSLDYYLRYKKWHEDFVFLESLPDISNKEDNMIKSKELDPNGINPNKPGAKLDAGKAPVRRGLLEYFPRACMAVAQVSASGAKKYTWNGWESVENGIDRYGDAEVRHICKAVIEGPVDNDFGHLHAMHEAWGALARLELILRKMEEEGHANLY